MVGYWPAFYVVAWYWHLHFFCFSVIFCVLVWRCAVWLILFYVFYCSLVLAPNLHFFNSIFFFFPFFSEWKFGLWLVIALRFQSMVDIGAS